ncbi:class I fructose-bisphosphate aldolase [Nocardia sp. NPDC060256]|uniref:class I fructose-bisphosphate aldolase n=1 Tax=unclassified Nocardia TaxID=2637762 RepID=UPI00365F3951
MRTCREIATQLMAPGKGILAADESIGTMSTRLENAGVEGTAENRRVYRELLATTPDLANGVSGIILCDETLNQHCDSTPFAQALRDLGILPGIKVDTGAKACPGLPGETVTEGLDGLAARLTRYAELGAMFAKWRAVYAITDSTPTAGAIAVNASALARYAAACQEAGLVPIVEPELVMTGGHSQLRCAEVTAAIHAEVRTALELLNVDLAGMVLKPNMIVEGADNPDRTAPADVAAMTGNVLQAWPDHLAGVAFLSGGQPPDRATANLAALQHLCTPWPLTFSFGRALVTPALLAWRGDATRYTAGQSALAERVRANAAAVRLRTELQRT